MSDTLQALARYFSLSRSRKHRSSEEKHSFLLRERALSASRKQLLCSRNKYLAITGTIFPHPEKGKRLILTFDSEY